MAAGRITLSRLDAVAHFAPLVADRIWSAWWSQIKPRDVITALVEASVTNTKIPLVFVAHKDEQFCGTVSLIASDCKARPQLTPWAAALWVEPQFRRCGIASLLLQEVRIASAHLQFPAIYLCSKPNLEPFYLRNGWTIVERQIGEPPLTLYSISSGSGPAPIKHHGLRGH